MAEIKDSGERRQFETGAVRDIQAGKGLPHLMPMYVIGHYYTVGNPDRPEIGAILDHIGYFLEDNNTGHLQCALVFFKNVAYEKSSEAMFLDVSVHFEEGAEKYGLNNWQKGIPAECYIDSALRHFFKWLRGDQDEPHDRAFVWNLMCCIWEVDYSPRAKGESKVLDIPEAGVENVPNDRAWERLGDIPCGPFIFNNRVYVKENTDTDGTGVAVAAIADGEVDYFNPDILVTLADMHIEE